MLKNYIKIAFRNLQRHKTYSFINIAGLAMGMLCCILIALWVKHELSFDQFHSNKDNLYELVSKYDDSYWSYGSPWALAPTIKKDFPEVKSYSRFSANEVVVTYGEKKFYESSAMVDPDFLSMFSFSLLKGNPETVLDNKESVVISEKVAKKYFGEEDPIGKMLLVNNNLNFAVTGVIKNVPSNSSLQFEVLIPIANLGEQVLSTWSIESTSFIQLKENTSLPQFQSKIAGTTAKYDKRVENKKVINDVQSIAKIHLYSLNDIGPILYIYIFALVAFVVLIVACINFINLVTAKVSLRSREIGIRKVIGAKKRQLITQFFGETFLLSVAAFILAYVCATILLPKFNELTNSDLILNFYKQPWLLVLSVGIILLTTLFAGSYPALMLSTLKPIKSLKNSKSTSSKGSIRWVLVVMQFSVSIILIVITFTMNSQMRYIQNKNLGFNKDQVIEIPLDTEISKKFETIKNELLTTNGILNVTRALGSPNNLAYQNPVYWEGHGPKDYQTMNYASIDYDYFETFDIEFVEGRGFSKEFSTDPQNYIVNEAAVKLMGFDSPVGKMFSIWQNEGKIIGIVKDFHSISLHNEIQPLVFTMNRFIPMSQIFIRISPNNIKESISAIESIWAKYNSSMPFQYKFLDEVFNEQYTNEKRIEALFENLSLLAIIISCMGLFGLAAFSAETRTKEIGIRKVLGASVSGIVSMMLSDFAKWIIISVVIASPIAYLIIAKWLENFAYHIQVGIYLFLISNLTVIAIAVASVSWQAIKAAVANPVESLKNE